MSQRMANAIWNNTYPSLAGALALGLVALAGAASHAAPVQAESLAVVGAAGLLARAALPVVGPLLEVRQLSKLSRDAIEAAVDPKEHLQVSGCHSSFLQSGCVSAPLMRAVQ